LLKFVLQGAVDTQNIWNIGFWWSKQLPTDGTIDYNALAADVLSKFKTQFWSAATSPWTGACATATTLNTCKTYGYDSGVLTGEGTASITAVAGTASQTSPGYTAACVTLQTANFGRSHRGRVYLPYTSGTPTNLQLSLSQAYVDNLRNFLQNTTWAGTNGSVILEPLVVSRTHGTTDQIKKIRMDSKPDTQRGRISKLVPAQTLTSVVSS
jgi:hypothetical protein